MNKSEHFTNLKISNSFKRLNKLGFCIFIKFSLWLILIFIIEMSKVNVIWSHFSFCKSHYTKPIDPIVTIL